MIYILWWNVCLCVTKNHHFLLPSWAPEAQSEPPVGFGLVMMMVNDQTHLEDDVVQLVLCEVFIHLFQDGSEPLNWNEPLPLNVKQPRWKLSYSWSFFELNAQ